jgi:proton-dependent oligopeptide transporter, POT family
VIQADGMAYPPQIKYIIGNEGCERFSFYGMKNILTFFMIHNLLLTEPTAKANYHLFVSAVYFFPLLGGWLSDRYLGKYRTIFFLSLIYCVGHACLAIFDDQPDGFYLGLGLIALGSGGIKPCVSALVGDQFSSENKHLAKRVFALFYWIINFGSFTASALIPKMLEWYGPKWAFGIPGVLMFIATVILWLGRDLYVHVPPTGPNPHSFSRVIYDMIRGRAAERHPTEAVDGARAVLRVMLIFAPVPVFWALFDQKGSTWIVQATAMDRQMFGVTVAPSQLMALNPLLVMLLIPFGEYVLYPACERAGYVLTPLRRMRLGMAIAGLSFVAVGLLQLSLDGGTVLSVTWQAIPYLLITMAEVLVSTTGLEFAYSQAPIAMKSTIMSFWNLTVTFGNLIAAGVAALNVWTGAAQYMAFAGMIFVAAALFWLVSRRYVPIDHFRAV